MSQVGNPIVSPTTRSRLAQIMGFPSSSAQSRAQSPQKQKQQDDDWFIPYNGPIEPPRPLAGRPRGNTFGMADTLNADSADANDDTFGFKGITRGRTRAASNATAGTRKSYASPPSTPITGPKSSYSSGGGGGIGEAPVHSAASVYSARDRTSTYSNRERASAYSTRERTSMYSTRDRDSDWENEREREREQRGSIASFLTFGQGSRKPNVSVNVNVSGYASSGLLPSASTSRHPGLSPVSQHHGLSPMSPRSMPRSEDRAFVFPAAQYRARRSEDSTSSAQVHVYAMPSSHTHAQAQRGRQRSGTVESTNSTRPAALSLTAADRARGKGKELDGGAGTPGGSTEVSAGLTPGSTSTGLVGGGSSSGHNPNDSTELRLNGRVEARGRSEREQWDDPDAGQTDEEEQVAYDQSPGGRFRSLSHSVSQPVLPRAAPSIQRHPYAVVFPSAGRDEPQVHTYSRPRPQPSLQASPQRPPQQRPLAPPIIVPPSHFSTSTTSASARHRQPTSHAHLAPANAVSPAAIAAALNNQTHQHAKLGLARGLLRSASGSRSRPGSLKASFSTPNLRGIFKMGASGTGAKGLEKTKVAKTQYAAETWCDALMFPRPRFRAHVVSPPESPSGGAGTAVAVDERLLKEVGRSGTLSNGPIVSADVLQSIGDGQGRGGEGRPLKRAATTVAQSTRPASPPFVGLPPLTLPRTSPRQGYFSDVVKRDPPQHDYLLTDPLAISKKRDQEPLSPAEESLRRVLAEGELRSKEREAWNEVARTSFQNRRSRSLSRTRSRKKSGPAPIPRVRVESDLNPRDVERERKSQDRPGLTRALTVGITALAAEAFNQPTPTISTVSASHSGGSDSNAHSRNTSTSIGQSKGHSRNTSWGKVTLKKLCAPEPDGLSDVAGSPREEKLEGALLNEKTARLRVRGRREEAEEADVQFMVIAPLPPASDHSKDSTNRKHLEVVDPSGRAHSQNSNVSDSLLDVPTVGLALSTPPNLSPVQPEVPDLSAHPYAQPSTPRLRAEPVPVSASYAGPHPTSSQYNRHRFPPHAQQSSMDSKSPEKRMFAALQNGAIRQVSTPEITQSPVAWDRSGTHAYASTAADEKRESTLGVEEVLLSRAFQRNGGGSAEDSGFASVDDHEYTQPLPPRAPSPSQPALSRVRRKPVALNPYSGIPSLSHTVTTATHTDMAEPELVQHVVRHASSELPSPSSQSSWSQTSPRALGSMDDLEPFRDLFYKPSQAGSDQRTPSSELRRRLGSRSGSWGDERDAEFGESRHRTLSQRLDGLQEERPDGQSPLPGLNDNVSLQLGSPLRVDYDETQDFPEDIQSSRASSDIEHQSIEETLRLGSVALAVPETTHTERRQSTTLSFGDTEDGESLRPNRDTVITASSLGIPATAEELIRTSFLTSTTGTSRMSTLIGDFPAPPVADGVTPPSAAVLHTYFTSPEPRGDTRRPQTSSPDTTR